jgi:hypothetical protein
MNPLNYSSLDSQRKLPTLLLLLACLGGAGAAQAQARYSYSADGSEVTDAQTGLVWRRCSQGQSWSGSTCAGSASFYNHEQALALVKAEAGWRLPNVKELSSLVDASRFNPSIDTAAFPSTPSSYFWSSTPYAGDARFALHLAFNDGRADREARASPNHVRLVR